MITGTTRFPAFVIALGALFVAGARAGAAAGGMDERMILVAPVGADREDREIRLWQERVKASPDREDLYERLGWAYIGKARRTLDAGYYKLAEKTADVMDARFGSNAQSRLLRGHVLHNLHRFHEAELIARQLVAERGLSFDYALLSDALMEQGKLDESVAACQKEMNLKPGLEAYSRAANLRWLKGDLPGAIQAMEEAVRASSPLDPANCAWTLARLSGYTLQSGQASKALELSDAALRCAPDYPPALLGRGRALIALGRNGEAAAPLRRAAELNPLPEYQWWLADTLRATGRADEAAQVEEELKRRGEAADPRTTSLFLATRHEEPATAVRLAREELDNRSDVLTRDALAWALAEEGDLPEARTQIQGALAEQTRDARIFLHAGEIALASGDRDGARRFFDQARPNAATLTPAEHALLLTQ
jgi:tetratricopeptide (TPR) repeat protein